MRRRTRSISRPSPKAYFEALEPRTLLNGLTIITHGYEPFSDARPKWIDYMGAAVYQEAGPTTAIYTIRVEPNGNAVKVASITRLYGPSPTSSSSTNGETVLLLDWAAASGVFSNYYPASLIANAVLPFLQNAVPDVGIGAPLAQGSIQIIGHSRGASVASSLANALGKAGIWVDQVTTLDPVPVGADPAVTFGNNVIFADNYYQTDDDPSGSSLIGAANFGPLALGGRYGIADGYSHSDVHLFYHGTISPTAYPNDGTFSAPASWYTANNLPRATSGFYLTRIGGGTDTRPLEGISSAFGGTASRSAITRTGTQWPNVGNVAASLTTLEAGHSFTVDYDYQDFDSASKVQWFLDPDTNPYNNNSIAVSTLTSLATTGSTVTAGTQTLTFTGRLGNFHLEGRITDGTNTRYAYAPTLITVIPPQKNLVFTTQPVTTTAGTLFAPVIKLVDAAGQLITDDTSEVTLTLAGTAGGTLNGTKTVQFINGIATFTDLAITKAGTYTVTASDDAILPSKSAPFTITPDLTSAQLYLVQQPDATIVGKPLIPTLIVNAQDQFGNLITTEKSLVNVTIASSPVGATLTGISSLAMKAGAATFSNLKLSTAGDYVLNVAAPALAINTPQQFTITILPGTTTVAKPAVSASYSFGKTIALSATLKSSAPTTVPFTGTATITDQNSNILGTANLTAAGLAKFSLTGILPGTYTCTLAYPGDDNHTAVTSPTFILKVNPAATTTKLVLSPTAPFYSQPLTLTATVSSTSAPGTTRTGTITFKEGINILGVVAVDSNNTASLTLPTPTVGSHTYTATYSGDTNFKLSAAPARGITIKKNNTQTTLLTDAGSPLFPNVTFTLTATVNSLTLGSPTPTGTITFKDGSKILAVVTLDNSGIATLTASLLTVGKHSLTARYSGDSFNNLITSPVLVQVVTAPPPV